MAGEGHIRNTQAPLEGARDGARRGALARGALRAARIRCRTGLPRLGQGDALARVIPTVRYRDVPAAVAWLCKAFGLKKHRVVAGDDGAPCYAELKFGGSIVMIAPIEDTAFGRLMVQPDELGGVETQVCYLYVDNVAAHYARAKAAGAVVVIDPDDDANKGRGYSCRDPEGHVWNFGSYDPWQNRRGEASRERPPRRDRHALVAVLLLSVAAILTGEMPPMATGARVGAALAETRTVEPAAADVRRQREEVQRPADEEREAEAERAARAAAERAAAEQAAAEGRARLAEAHGAREKAEREAAAVRAQLEGALNAKAAAERAARQARVRLAAAETEAREARATAALEHKKRLAADEAVQRSRKRVAAFRRIRPRPRVWCLNPNAPNPAANRGARLSGFCKG